MSSYRADRPDRHRPECRVLDPVHSESDYTVRRRSVSVLRRYCMYVLRHHHGHMMMMRPLQCYSSILSESQRNDGGVGRRLAGPEPPRRLRPARPARLLTRCQAASTGPIVAAGGCPLSPSRLKMEGRSSDAAGTDLNDDLVVSAASVPTEMKQGCVIVSRGPARPRVSVAHLPSYAHSLRRISAEWGRAREILICSEPREGPPPSALTSACRMNSMSHPAGPWSASPVTV